MGLFRNVRTIYYYARRINEEDLKIMLLI